jgi:hypothetical protein
MDEKYEGTYILWTTPARKLGGVAAIQCAPAARRPPFSIDRRRRAASLPQPGGRRAREGNRRRVDLVEVGFDFGLQVVDWGWLGTYEGWLARTRGAVELGTV